VVLPEVPAGDDWDLRITGFSSEEAFQDGTYAWLGRRSGVSVASEQNTGAAVLLLRVEALQCTRKPLPTALMGAVVTPLNDGRVLFTGGVEALSADGCEGCFFGTASKRVQIYDPITGGFAVVAAMASGRVGHSATALEDGRVLVIGGADRLRLGGDAGFAVGDALLHSSAAIYDPSSDRWSEVDAPWTRRAFHTTTRSTADLLITSGGFADNDRVHADLYRFRVEGAGLTIVAIDELACPRVGHIALKHGTSVILWGGSRCADGSSSRPEIWDADRGLTLSEALTWGSEANLSFAAAVELRAGTFLIVGGATYRDGALQNPNRRNSYYYLAPSQRHVRAPELPDGLQALALFAVRLSGGLRAMMGGGFSDIALQNPNTNYSLFVDDNHQETFTALRVLPGLGGSISAAPAGSNQIVLGGGAAACAGCAGGIEISRAAAVFSAAQDH
jgi:hypothetical protein